MLDLHVCHFVVCQNVLERNYSTIAHATILLHAEMTQQTLLYQQLVVHICASSVIWQSVWKVFAHNAYVVSIYTTVFSGGMHRSTCWQLVQNPVSFVIMKVSQTKFYTAILDFKDAFCHTHIQVPPPTPTPILPHFL